MPAALETPEKVVWARGPISVTSCPTSYITPRSLTWIDEFHAWRRFGRTGLDRLGAKQAEAFLILEEQTLAEESRGRD